MTLIAPKMITLEELQGIPLPPATRTHQVIPFDGMIDHTIQSVQRIHGLGEPELAIGTNRKSTQFFAVLHWRVSEDLNYAIGLRNSSDKSLAAGYVDGPSVFVCSNLMFQSKNERTVRRNQHNGFAEWKGLVDYRIPSGLGRVREAGAKAERLRAIACDGMRGAELIGLAMYEGALAPSQGMVAMREWREASHEEFKPRDAWSLYNAGTEALKRGQVHSVVDRYQRWDTWLERSLDRRAAPAFPLIIDAEDLT